MTRDGWAVWNNREVKEVPRRGEIMICDDPQNGAYKEVVYIVLRVIRYYPGDAEHVEVIVEKFKECYPPSGAITDEDIDRLEERGF